MRFLSFFTFILIVLIFYSFSFGWGPRLTEDVLRDKLIKKVGKIVEKKYGMSLQGIGGGSKNGKIREMSITFGRYGKPLNIEQCRKIILDCIQVYLDEINSNQEIRPYLMTYPFTEKNLDLGILNFYPDGSISLDPDICDVSAAQGFIHYRTCTALLAPYNSDFKETYDEALAKVKQKPIVQEEQNFTIFPANS